jgi:hypothetical protein
MLLTAVCITGFANDGVGFLVGMCGAGILSYTNKEKETDDEEVVCKDEDYASTVVSVGSN